MNTLKRAILIPEGEGTSEELLIRFLLFHRTMSHPTLEGKSPAGSPSGRNPRTIQAPMKPRSNESTSLNHGRKYGALKMETLCTEGIPIPEISGHIH